MLVCPVPGFGAMSASLACTCPPTLFRSFSVILPCWPNGFLPLEGLLEKPSSNAPFFPCSCRNSLLPHPPPALLYSFAFALDNTVIIRPAVRTYVRSFFRQHMNPLAFEFRLSVFFVRCCSRAIPIILPLFLFCSAPAIVFRFLFGYIGCCGFTPHVGFIVSSVSYRTC